MKHNLTTMKTLLSGIFAAIIVFSQLAFCVAQSNQPISLKVNSFTVENFPDTEAVFEVLEQGNIAFWITGKSKPSWDDVKELMRLPVYGEISDEKENDPVIYYNYLEISMVEFTNAYEGKIVGFFVPARNMETGIAKFILALKYDDFKKIVNKKYMFEIDF